MNQSIDASLESIDQINQSLFDLDERLQLVEGAISIDGNNIGISGSVPAADSCGDGSSLTGLNASSLSSGTVATARLGSGTADSGTFLRGDSSWAIPPSSGVSGTTNYIPLFTSGTTVGNSAIYQSNGNVGIGTAEPQGALDVQSGRIRVTSLGSNPSSGVGVEINYSDGVGGIIAYDRASHEYMDLNLGSQQVYLASGGNVGIGISAPVARLDVFGGNILVRSSNDTVGSIISFGSPSYYPVASIRSNPDCGGNCGMGFWTRVPGTEFEPVRISADGNVGTGTTSPSTDLHKFRADSSVAGLTLENTLGSMSMASAESTFHTNAIDFYDRLVVSLIENAQEQQKRLTTQEQAARAQHTAYLTQEQAIKAQQAAYLAQQQEMKNLKACLAHLENVLSNR